MKVKGDEKRLISILILRNIISDLCCCLDSLERGGNRTITNNLRMAFEDYCCAIAIQWNPKAYSLFLKKKLDIPRQVSFAKKYREGYEDFGKIYGMLSDISHHSKLSLVTRQVLFIERDIVYYAHLKPINPNKLIFQASSLRFIAFLLIEVGTMAEEICIDLIERPYFGIKTFEGYQKNLNIPEVIFSIKFDEKVSHLFIHN